MRRISVLPSADDVESFTFPLHRMKTPRGSCPSTNSVAPLGYVEGAVIPARRRTAGSGRLQNSRSFRFGHSVQFSTISRPYGARTEAPARPARLSEADTSHMRVVIAVHLPNGEDFGAVATP